MRTPAPLLRQRLDSVGLLLVLGASVAISLWLGRDLNWDFINYHFYGAHLMVEQRLDQDYFAASLQSTLNPLIYVPQYLMMHAGWHSLAIGVMLATVHALNLVFVWLITREILPADRRDERLWPLLASILALLAPLFLTTSGTSFSDPGTSTLVLAALWLLLRSTTEKSAPVRWLALAGLLLGIAAGLKITNVVLALAIALPLSFRGGWGHSQGPMRRAGWLLAGGLLGFLLFHGWWSWQLWQEFGNPVFPLFNSAFGSADFPAITYRDTRFLSSGFVGLLTLPFDMLRPVSWLYAENVAVDLRFAVLVLLLSGTTAACWVRYRRVQSDDSVRVPNSLKWITLTFLSLYLFWGLSSRIGRYALPLWLLLGPMIVAWAHIALNRRYLVLALLVAVALAQAYILSVAGNPRWSPAPWATHWLKVEVPPEMTEKPVTVLTLGMQSYSAFIPSLHPQSRVVNLVGQYVQPAGGRMTQRMSELLADSGAELRVLFPDKRTDLPYESTPPDADLTNVRATLSVYELDLMDAPCQPLRIEQAPPPNQDQGSSKSTGLEVHDGVVMMRFHVCAALPLGPAEYAATVKAKVLIDKAFNAIERACGDQLNPSNSESQRGGAGWSRTYFNSLNRLMTDGQVVLIRPFRSVNDVSLGPLAAWLTDSPPDCPRLPGAIVSLK